MAALAIALFLASFSSYMIVVSLAYGSKHDIERLDPAYARRLYAPRLMGRRRGLPIRILVLFFSHANAAVAPRLRTLRIACCVCYVLLATLVGVLMQVL